MKALLQIVRLAAADRTSAWALATLVRTKGSTYRKPGARLLADEQGRTIGVLSGGCLEEEIARQAGEIIADGQCRLLEFDTRRLYGCDGKVEILVEPISAAGGNGNLLTAIGDRLASREIVRVRTRYEGPILGSDLLPVEALVTETEGTLIHSIPLPVRLLLFGAGPEIEPLCLLGSSLGWLIEQAAHPSALTINFRPDAQTAALIMTHNFGRDLAALDRLLPLDLPYIGLLGPRKRHAELLARLHDFHEVNPAWLENLHAPAGLDIGSESPEEIALSIVSEVAAVLAKRRGGFLRDRATAIHDPVVCSRKVA
ncbi:MAG: XdhC family protein [Chthoniobacteraceae bacterium]|nr:XdhC family protein [Chthoniobacteraceae bacterium]